MPVSDKVPFVHLTRTNDCSMIRLITTECLQQPSSFVSTIINLQSIKLAAISELNIHIHKVENYDFPFAGAQFPNAMAVRLIKCWVARSAYFTTTKQIILTCFYKCNVNISDMQTCYLYTNYVHKQLDVNNQYNFSI